MYNAKNPRERRKKRGHNQKREYGKGQLISECLLGDIDFPKKTTKNLTNFCPGI